MRQRSVYNGFTPAALAWLAAALQLTSRTGLPGWKKTTDSIVHAAANAQRAVDLILGSTFEEENETSNNAGDAAAMNIAPTIYGHAHL